MSTRGEVFPILKHLDTPTLVFLSVLTIIEMICPKIWAKPPSKNEKRPLPADVNRSKSLCLSSLLIFLDVRVSVWPKSNVGAPPLNPALFVEDPFKSGGLK